MASAHFPAISTSQEKMKEMIASARSFFEDMDDELDDTTLWEGLATRFADKSIEEIEGYCNASINELTASMLGLHPTLDYSTGRHDMQSSSESCMQEPAPIIATDPSTRELIATLREGLPDLRTTKGQPWSSEEHCLFLLGLKFCGKGDWKSISKYFVLSRTPTQTGSHAQKFFTRILKHKQAHNCPSKRDVNTMSQVSYRPSYYMHNNFCERHAVLPAKYYYMHDGIYEQNVGYNRRQATAPMPSNIYQPTTNQQFSLD